jgi:hypothetical protein
MGRARERAAWAKSLMLSFLLLVGFDRIQAGCGYLGSG